MASNHSTFSVLCWNVRGLGDPNKCDLVKDTLINNIPDLTLLQETKLSLVNRFKESTFLPSSLSDFISLNALNASRGLITAWNKKKFKLLTSFSKLYSISSHFESESNATRFWVSNIYGPNTDDERPAFFQELKEIADQIQGPWLLAGDFNAIRAAHERSSLHMTRNETIFNDIINELMIQELPLLDRSFTWSNMQHPPLSASWIESSSMQPGMTFSQIVLSIPFLEPLPIISPSC
jgi:exonuclease III